MSVDISGLDRADVLAALYNASRPQGMGFMAYSATDMTREEATELLTNGDRFDYLKGRVMKVTLRDGSLDFDEWGYDRDNGQGAAQRAVDALRAAGPTNDAIAKQHRDSVVEAGALTMNVINQETRRSGHEITLGLADVKDKLRPHVLAAMRDAQK